MEIKKATNYKQSIIAILMAEKLPVTDLPDSLENFLVAMQNDQVIGVAGLEVYGDYGLLRSLAVNPDFRGQGIAGKLLSGIEAIAGSKGLKIIYLLTETAPGYFDGKKYKKITRTDVPAEVQQSSEFSYVCPQSAIAMEKNLQHNRMKNILVLCTGNSCRSQIAEGYLRHYAGDKANVYSAGIETHGVNPKAIQVMLEDHIDISKHTSNHVDEYLDISFDYLITVCDNANENCPYIPGKMQRFHQNFPDPAKATGNADEVMNEFRKVRDTIKLYSENFVKEHLSA